MMEVAQLAARGLDHAPLALTASVAMHVSWNLMARQAPQQAWPLWWALAAHLLLFAPWGWWCLWQEGAFSPALLALALLSALANAVYFLGLAQAYEHAPVSLVYPMVRSSPLLIALWGQWLLGQSLSGGSWLGLFISSLGLFLMALSTLGGPDGAQGEALKQARRALPWALLAMLATSVYSLSDKAATAHLPSTGSLLGFMSCSYLAAWVALTLRLQRRSGRWTPPSRPPWWMTLGGGVCIGWAYVLVIHAMRNLSAAHVVSYTNAGIVVATVVGMVAFGERQRWRPRLLAALLIMAGLATLARA
jgi:phosphonate utilization associated putative membrane protein